MCFVSKVTCIVGQSHFKLLKGHECCSRPNPSATARSRRLFGKVTLFVGAMSVIIFLLDVVERAKVAGIVGDLPPDRRILATRVRLLAF